MILNCHSVIPLLPHSNRTIRPSGTDVGSLLVQRGNAEGSSNRNTVKNTSYQPDEVAIWGYLDTTQQNQQAMDIHQKRAQVGYIKLSIVCNLRSSGILMETYPKTAEMADNPITLLSVLPSDATALG